MARWLILLLLLLCACTPAGTPGGVQSQPTPYHPLQVGNEWIFRGSDQRRILRAVKQEIINNIPCTLVETYRGEELVAQEHIYSTADGVYALTLEGRRLSQPLPILKLPPRRGLTWVVDFKMTGGNYRGTYQIGAEEVTVPFGKFQAITLQAEVTQQGDRRTSSLSWYAENVGLVKQVIRLAKQTMTYELEQFTQKQ